MSHHYRVLLVEDDPMIARTVTLGLSYKGFDIQLCATCAACLELLDQTRFDMLLLDINLPDGNGLDLCRRLRSRFPELPILLVTALTDEASAVTGLRSGADDYIRKPYGLQELAARMERLLAKRGAASPALIFGPLQLDPDSRSVSLNDLPLKLGKREFDILTLLMRKAGAVVTRNDILDLLEEDGIYDRTIDSHVSHLRRKLRDAGGGVEIAALYGVGYQLK